jgi:hypothetical protein
MEPKRQVTNREAEAWRIAITLSFCMAKIVGKFKAYPEVDSGVFHRLHQTIGRGMTRLRARSTLGDFCQELRAVTACPAAELLRPSGADDTDARITAIAQVVRQRTGLDDDVFRDLLSGLLSWEPTDKAVILEALTGIIRS